MKGAKGRISPQRAVGDKAGVWEQGQEARRELGQGLQQEERSRSRVLILEYKAESPGLRPGPHGQTGPHSWAAWTLDAKLLTLLFLLYLGTRFLLELCCPEC